MAGLKQRHERLVLEAAALRHLTGHPVPRLQADVIRILLWHRPDRQHLHLRVGEAQSFAAAAVDQIDRAALQFGENQRVAVVEKVVAERQHAAVVGTGQQ